MQWYAVIEDFYGVRVCKLDPLDETTKTITVVATKENGFKRRWHKRELHDNYRDAADQAKGLLLLRISELERKRSRYQESLRAMENTENQ